MLLETMLYVLWYLLTLNEYSVVCADFFLLCDARAWVTPMKDNPMINKYTWNPDMLSTSRMFSE